jgi:hypothetical protein
VEGAVVVAAETGMLVAMGIGDVASFPLKGRRPVIRSIVIC